MMKLLLVTEKDTTRVSLESHLRPRGFDFIHYRNPIKAMDNIDEVAPDLVLFSAEDFPRHWKPFIALLRGTRTKEQTAFVLLRGDLFSFDEAAKATHLEVNGVLPERPEDRESLQTLEDIVTRYSSMKEIRNDVRYIPSASDNTEFVFTHPVNYQIITGILFDLSPGGAAFIPDDPKSSSDIPAGSKIKHCSLRLGTEFFNVSCHVVRNSVRIALKFIDITEELEQAIIRYIDMRAERELGLLLKEK